MSLLAAFTVGAGDIGVIPIIKQHIHRSIQACHVYDDKMLPNDKLLCSKDREGPEIAAIATPPSDRS